MKPLDERKLAEISRRWRAASLIERWRGLPVAARETLLAELEEASRELRERHPEKSEHFTAAMDALDAVALDGTLNLWSQAADDVKDLLEEVSRLRREIQRGPVNPK